MRQLVVLGALGCVWATRLSAAAADEAVTAPTETPVRAVSIRYENDIFGGTDRYYTNGASLAWTRTARGAWMLRRLWDWAGLPDREGHRETLGFELAQAMNSPADIRLVNPPVGDRPYCGILTIGTTLQVERNNLLTVLKVYTGVIGPGSLACQTQKQVHRWMGSPIPQGWSTQVKAEPVLNLVYETRWRRLLVGERAGFCVDAIPAAGIMLGNVLTQAQLSAQVRAGWHVPEDFGITLLRGAGNLPSAVGLTSRQWGLYAFAGANGNAVAHNVAIDGNLFRDFDGGADRIPFFSGVEWGFALTGEHMRITFTRVRWSREFRGQLAPAVFGAITASFLY